MTIRLRYDVRRLDERGLTLIEIAAVILLFGLMAALSVSKFDSLAGWRSQYGFRSFLNTWEFVFREAQTRREAYRLIIDIDRGQYSVLREIPLRGTAARQVDFLKNLRTRGEQERRERESTKELLSLEDEFRQEDERQSESLESLFYEFAYSDPSGSVRLTRPLDFPQLAEPKELPEGIIFRDVKLGPELYEKGEVAIRFSPLGASDFAVVHIESDGQVFSALLNPSTGELELQSGYIDYEWTFSNDKERSK